jgi:hypothetical protein
MRQQLIVKIKKVLKIISGIGPKNETQPMISPSRETEVFGVAYPKCGSTWFRVLLGRYIQEYFHLSQLPVLDVGEYQMDWFQKYDGPLIAFTHDPLTWENQTADDLSRENVVNPYLGKAVILLVRHPLDVIVSSYMQTSTLQQIDGKEYDVTLEQFTNDPVYGLVKLFRFYQIWADSLQHFDTSHILRYESLRHDTPGELIKILHMLKMPVVPEFVHTAVDFASFNNMRQMEESHKPLKYISSGYWIFGKTDHSLPESYQVRRGKVGGYKDYFDKETQIKLEQQVASHMPPLYGYGSGKKKG